jgi:hypothetical protein
MAIKKTITKAKAPAAKRTSTVGISISKSGKNDMRKWEIESALSTLKRADEIRKDSKMMNDVKRLAQDQVNVLNNYTKS